MVEDIPKELAVDSSWSSWERRFDKKIGVKGVESWLCAYSLLNDICTLYFNLLDYNEIKSVALANNIAQLTDRTISGKRKRGAGKIKKGEVVGSVTRLDGTNFDVRSPVSGHVLEFNPILLNNTSETQWTNCFGEGYVIVIARNIADEYDSGVCFAFKNGKCSRGDSCKFKHV